MSSLIEWLAKIAGGGEETPEPPSDKYAIAIDPGHGGKFPGATVPHPDNPDRQVYEKDITLSIGLYLGKLLERAGHYVIYTRETDQHLAEDLNADLRQRTDIANNAGAELFISIHCNSAENPSASGIETYYYPSSENGKFLAKVVQKNLVQAFPTHHDRGIKSADFVVLRLTTMPACLVETEFMTNPDGIAFLLDARNQSRIAQAIYDAVMEYFTEP